MEGPVLVWLNIPDLVTTIMAGDVRTSRQIYISFFVPQARLEIVLRSLKKYSVVSC